MKVRHWGHAALEIHIADQHILVDPGNFADPRVAQLSGLTAIIITHQHPDHVDPERLAALVRANPEAVIIAEPDAAHMIREHKDFSASREAGAQATELAAGRQRPLGVVTVEAVGGRHAIIHPDIPRIGNTGFVLSAPGEPRFGITGDSLEPVQQFHGIDALAFAITAPWSKMSETIDFLRAVRPVLALPVHDAVASPQGRGIFMKQATAHAPAETEVREWPDDDRTIELTFI